MFNRLVISYYSIDIYDVLIVQDRLGNLLSIKIEEYERERTTGSQYIYDDQIIH